LTNPACISAEAGVGAVIEESSHVWNGTSADCIIAASSRLPSATASVVSGTVSTAASIPETVVASVACDSVTSAIPRNRLLARKYRRA
jgi:hypothetical protein